MPKEPKNIPVKWEQVFETIEGLQTDQINRIEIEREVVPLILVPGIMGSRLKNAKTGKMAWDPDDTMLMLKQFGWRQFDAAGRKRILVGKTFSPGYLKVDLDGNKDHNENFKDYPGAVDRGWTSVMWGSYGEFITKLQDHEWSEPIRHCFDFPVHASGYNWTNTNYTAGRKLKDEIKNIIKTYKNEGRRCEKVILISHSMGGLVSRSACVLHGASQNVLGVIHGVQPATGAPAAYWRMHGGFERPGSAEDDRWYHWFTNPKKKIGHKVGGTVASWVLGPDGKAVTALLANMPGGLELLPNKLYKTNEGNPSWLILPEKDETTRRLPLADPYVEIYLLKNEYYRMVNPSWLDPGNVIELAKKSKSKKKKLAVRFKSPWGEYVKQLDKARKFHNRLQDKVHPETISFYSTGIHTFDLVEFKRELHSWTNTGKRILRGFLGSLPMKGATETGKILTGLSILSPWGLARSAASGLAMAAIKDRDWYVNRGGFREYVDENDIVIEEGGKEEADIIYLLTLELPKGSGDGTVPDSSGNALAPNIKEALVIDKDDELWLDRGHEPIYRTKTGQSITFAGIENFLLEKIDGKRR